MRSSLLSFLLYYILILAQVHLSAAGGGFLTNNSKDNNNLGSLIRTEYEKLTPTSKFATGVVVGFSGWRCLEKSAITFVKGAGAALCVTEILHQTGWTANLNTQDDTNAMQQIQHSMKRAVEDCRKYMRQNLDPKKLRKKINACVEHDKPGSTGFAAGLLASILL